MTKSEKSATHHEAHTFSPKIAFFSQRHTHRKSVKVQQSHVLCHLLESRGMMCTYSQGERKGERGRWACVFFGRGVQKSLDQAVSLASRDGSSVV